MPNPFLWLHDHGYQSWDTGDGFSLGPNLVLLDVVEAGGTDDRPFGWVVGSPYWPGQYFKDDTNGILYPSFIPATAAADGGTVIELAGTSDGVATVAGALTRVIQLFATSAGVATVTGDLAFRYLYSTVAGTATVTGALDGVGAPAGFPVPYPFLGSGVTTTELAAIPLAGFATVTGDLDIIRELSGSISGTAQFGDDWVTTAQKSPITATSSMPEVSGTTAADTVDGDTSTFFRHTRVADGTITYDLGNPKNIDGIFIDNASGIFGGGTFHLEASVNNLHWTAISAGFVNPTPPNTITVSVSDPNTGLHGYQYLRLRYDSSATTNNDNTLAEVDLLGAEPWLTLTGPPHLNASNFGYPDSAGVATVTGTIFVGQLDGGGDPIIELAGSSAGVATVVHSGFITAIAAENTNIFTLYLYNNIGVSFDPTDTYTGSATLISNASPDGVTRDLLRVLYLLINVGVGFDDTDDESSNPLFVSQTYPDGDIVDFGRYLYLVLNLIRERNTQGGRLVILPGYNDRNEFNPRPAPPSNENT